MRGVAGGPDSRVIHMKKATLTTPYIGLTYDVAPDGDYEDALYYAMVAARCHMFNLGYGGGVDDMTRKWLGAREDLLSVWGDLITRTDGHGLTMPILL